MDFEAVVKKRKSVRAFEEKKVEEDKIDKILSLVNLAPSAGNLQAYKIFIVKNKKKIKLRGRNLYALQDATIACSYAQLAATNLGLASCWVGAFDEEEIKKIIKTDLLPVAILPIGYPAESPPRRVRKSLDEISQEIT